MIVKRELQTGDVVIEVRGNIVGDSVEEFREALHGAIDSPGNLILLDLEKVSTMNSRAIGVLLLARKKSLAAGKTIRIDKCGEALTKTFLALRFDTIFEMPGRERPRDEKLGLR
jgi:anti-anti-sigma factor